MRTEYLKAALLSIMVITSLIVIPVSTVSVVSASPGEIDLTPPTDDTMVVSKGAGDWNYGSKTYIYVGYYSAWDEWERGYIKFDVSSISGDVAKATLSVYAWRVNGNPTVYAAVVPKDGWKEGTLTWNRQEDDAGISEREGVPGDIIRLDEVDLTGEDRYYDWDVTEFFALGYGDDGYASFLLILADEGLASGKDDVVGFSSKEYSDGINAPILKIELGGVEVGINPAEQEGDPGDTLEFTVTVTNLDTTGHDFELTWEDTLGWPDITIDPPEVPLAAGDSGEATLTVTIPAEASPGGVNEITVTATAQDDSSITGSGTCVARVKKPGVENDEENIEIYVTGVLEKIDIKVEPNIWNIGDLPAGKNAENRFTVRNVGGVDVDITIKGSDAVDPTAPSTVIWTLSDDGMIGHDIFAMWFRLLGGSKVVLNKSEKTLVEDLVVQDSQQFDLILGAPSSMSQPGKEVKVVVTLLAVAA